MNDFNLKSNDDSYLYAPPMWFIALVQVILFSGAIYWGLVAYKIRYFSFSLNFAIPSFILFFSAVLLALRWIAPRQLLVDKEGLTYPSGIISQSRKKINWGEIQCIQEQGEHFFTRIIIYGKISLQTKVFLLWNFVSTDEYQEFCKKIEEKSNFKIELNSKIKSVTPLRFSLTLMLITLFLTAFSYFQYTVNQITILEDVFLYIVLPCWMFFVSILILLRKGVEDNYKMQKRNIFFSDSNIRKNIFVFYHFVFIFTLLFGVSIFYLYRGVSKNNLFLMDFFHWSIPVLVLFLAVLSFFFKKMKLPIHPAEYYAAFGILTPITYLLVALLLATLNVTLDNSSASIINATLKDGRTFGKKWRFDCFYLTNTKVGNELYSYKFCNINEGRLKESDEVEILAHNGFFHRPWVVAIRPNWSKNFTLLEEKVGGESKLRLTDINRFFLWNEKFFDQEKMDDELKKYLESQMPKCHEKNFVGCRLSAYIEGVRGNHKNALWFYELGCLLGDLISCHNLFAHVYVAKIQQDKARAIIQRLCESSNVLNTYTEEEQFKLCQVK